MSKYFTPIEFEVTPDPDLPPVTKTVWHQDKLNQAKEAIMAEVELIKCGQSKYTTYAIDPGRYGFPAVNALNAFVRAPSDKMLKSFEDCAKSTFGARAGIYFTEQLRTAMEVVNV